METNNIAHIIEAILFVAGEPVAIGDLAAALELSEMETMHAVEEMQKQYDADQIAYLFFISGAGLPLRIVNRFTVVGEDGSKTQKTVVGTPSEYDEASQTFDVAFSSVDDPSDTMVLQGVVLNKKLLEAKEGFNQYRHNFDKYLNYLLVGGTAVAYALQQRAQAEDTAWTAGAAQPSPLPSPVPVTSRFGWGDIWKSVTKAFCNLVSVVSFAVATAVSKVATVINAPILHVFAAVTYFTGVVAQVIADQLMPDPYYPTDSSGGGTQMDPPVVFI